MRNGQIVGLVVYLSHYSKLMRKMQLLRGGIERGNDRRQPLHLSKPPVPVAVLHVAGVWTPGMPVAMLLVQPSADSSAMGRA
jgi:hypothetical protein